MRFDFGQFRGFKLTLTKMTAASAVHPPLEALTPRGNRGWAALHLPAIEQLLLNLPDEVPGEVSPHGKPTAELRRGTPQLGPFLDKPNLWSDQERVATAEDDPVSGIPRGFLVGILMGFRPSHGCETRVDLLLPVISCQEYRSTGNGRVGPLSVWSSQMGEMQHITCFSADCLLQ